MEREAPVVLVQPGTPTVATSINVNDEARLLTVKKAVAMRLKEAAGVSALETQLELTLVSVADARAYRRDGAHVAERSHEFDEFAKVREAFVEGSECVLVKLIGENPAALTGVAPCAAPYAYTSGRRRAHKGPLNSRCCSRSCAGGGPGAAGGSE